MRLDFIACKYTHFIQYGKTIEYFFVKKTRILAVTKRMFQIQKGREYINKNLYLYSFNEINY